MAFKVPEQYRVRTGSMRTRQETHGRCGVFFVPHRPGQPPLRAISSDGEGVDEIGLAAWEHVSVSRPDRCPTWEEMCHIKSLFWDDEDCVMQLHPPKSEWVNVHPYCLHLWRPVQGEIPRPPQLFV